MRQRDGSTASNWNRLGDDIYIWTTGHFKPLLDHRQSLKIEKFLDRYRYRDRTYTFANDRISLMITKQTMFHVPNFQSHIIV